MRSDRPRGVEITAADRTRAACIRVAIEFIRSKPGTLRTWAKGFAFIAESLVDDQTELAEAMKVAGRHLVKAAIALESINPNVEHESENE